MADFKIAYKDTMQVEGGYANNKLDTGGETYKGISRKHNPSWKGWPIIDAIKPHTATEINRQGVSNAYLQELVKAFYLTNYWNINRLGEITDQQLANNVFDFGVNAGTKVAAKMLQKAYNIAIEPKDLVVDGIIGKGSLAAINEVPSRKVYDAFNDLRKEFYDGIIARNPSQAVFRKSWYSRIKPYK